MRATIPETGFSPSAGAGQNMHSNSRIHAMSFFLPILALVGAWLSFWLLSWPGLPGLLGLPSDISLPARMVVLAFVASLAMFPLNPLSAWRSRCQEREADRFAADLTGRPQDLASALVKMSAENLSNLFPHPWYALFYYGHPPVVERVRALREWACSSAYHSTDSPTTPSTQ